MLNYSNLCSHQPVGVSVPKPSYHNLILQDFFPFFWGGDPWSIWSSRPGIRSWGSGMWKTSSRTFGVKGQWSLSTVPPQEWEIDSTLGGCSRSHWVPGQSGDSIKIWGRPWRVSCGSMWGEGYWRQKPQEILISTSCAGIPQAKYPIRWEHSPSPQQTGSLKSCL